MLIEAVEQAISTGRQAITLEVRPSNHVALSPCQKYGFRKTGFRKDYYVDNREGAIIRSTEPIQIGSRVISDTWSDCMHDAGGVESKKLFILLGFPLLIPGVLRPTATLYLHFSVSCAQPGYVKCDSQTPANLQRIVDSTHTYW